MTVAAAPASSASGEDLGQDAETNDAIAQRVARNRAEAIRRRETRRRADADRAFNSTESFVPMAAAAPTPTPTPAPTPTPPAEQIVANTEPQPTV